MTGQPCRSVFVYGALRRGARKDLREFFEEEPELEVQLEDGSSVEAWVYFYRGEIRGKRRIVSGDYLKR